MARDSCLARVTAGAAMGGAVGGAVGAVYGTYEAIRYKAEFLPIAGLFSPTVCVPAVYQRAANFPAMHTAAGNQLGKKPEEKYTDFKNLHPESFVPGLLKIRHIGQTTLGSAAIFGLFLGAGSLIHCGKSY